MEDCAIKTPAWMGRLANAVAKRWPGARWFAATSAGAHPLAKTCWGGKKLLPVCAVEVAKCTDWWLIGSSTQTSGSVNCPHSATACNACGALQSCRAMHLCLASWWLFLCNEFSLASGIHEPDRRPNQVTWPMVVILNNALQVWQLQKAPHLQTNELFVNEMTVSWPLMAKIECKVGCKWPRGLKTWLSMAKCNESPQWLQTMAPQRATDHGAMDQGKGIHTAITSFGKPWRCSWCHFKSNCPGWDQCGQGFACVRLSA